MMLQSPNLVSHDGAGQGQEEHFLPHLSDTACSHAQSIGSLMHDGQRRSRNEVKEEVDGFTGV